MSKAIRRDPVLVYLDTSDYSRFGDVMRGKSNLATERVFKELIALKKEGRARFAYSATVLSELLQFDPAFPLTTQSKAEAVEILCGKVAFYWPMRLIAHDVAVYLGRMPADDKPLSFRSEWYPSASGELADLRGILEEQISRELASRPYSSRADRRRAEAKARKFRFDVLAAPVIDAVASIYKLDRIEVARAITPTLQGKISSLEGSRRMFEAIARPTAFARAYFSAVNQDQDLPHWISNVGDVLQNSLIEMRLKLRDCDKTNFAEELAAGVALSSRMILLALARQAESVASEFALDANARKGFHSVDTLLSVPSLELFFKAYKILVEQAAGVHGTGHDPERSAFGDLIHLLYLPHADLWRCDKRFRNVVSKVAGRYDKAAVNQLSDLPDRIAGLAPAV